MPKGFDGKFSHQGPDLLTQELVVALPGERPREFKPLFAEVYAKLRAGNRASGGGELIWLRMCEKLQALVYRGMVSGVVNGEIKECLG